MHDNRDPVVFHDGFKLQFRSGEDTSGCGSESQCPNQWCPTDHASKDIPPETQAEIDAILEMRKISLSSSNKARTAIIDTVLQDNNCTPGPVAYGFDRPAGDGPIVPMKNPRGDWCSGEASLNVSGCTPADCAALCCNNSACTAWVHGIDKGCDTVNRNPDAICCWMKKQSTQIVVHKSDFLTTGEVAGHGGAPAPSPSPSGGLSPMPPKWVPPQAPDPPAGKTVYSTLVYVYEWPSTETPRPNKESSHSHGPIAGRLAELLDLKNRKLISDEEYTAARQAALGI